MLANLDPTGSGQFQQADFAGRITYQASITTTDQTLSTKTIVANEVTTRYDGLGRPIARTQWLAPLPAQDPQQPAIAGLPGAPHGDGLSTWFAYDDHVTDLTDLSLSFADGSGLPVGYPLPAVDLGLASNAPGSAVAVRDPAGALRLQIRDAAGRQILSVSSDGTWQQIIYDLEVDGLVWTRVEDTLRNSSTPDAPFVSRQGSDGAGRVRRQHDAEGHLTEHITAAFSRRQRNALNDSTVQHLDYAGRVTGSTDPIDPGPSFTYNAADQILTRTDALGNTTTMVYDIRGRKIAEIDRLGQPTTFAYDALGQLTSIRDADAQAPEKIDDPAYTTRYIYDPRGLLLREAFPGHPDDAADPLPAGAPDYDARVYSYDAIGRLATRADQSGIITTYTYDHASRLTTRSYSSGAADDTFTYDAAGRLDVATSGRYSNQVQRQYTLTGLLEAETLTLDGQDYTVTYSYDAANRLASLSYPDLQGTLVSRSYTARDQLETLQLGDPASSLASFAYDALGRETSRSLANGLTTARTWRADHRVQTIHAPGVVQFSYDYDPNK